MKQESRQKERKRETTRNTKKRTAGGFQQEQTEADTRYKSTVPDTKEEVPEGTHQQDRGSLETYDKIRKEENVTVSGYGTRRLRTRQNPKVKIREAARETELHDETWLIPRLKEESSPRANRARRSWFFRDPPTHTIENSGAS